MNKNWLAKFFLILLFVIIGCKKTEAKIESSKTSLTQNDMQESEIFLDEITQFDEKKDGQLYVTKNIQLVFKNEENEFSLLLNNKKIDKIDFEKKEFDGVGYNVFLYESTKTNIKTIVIEALADIGTAWYYAIIIDNEKVSNKFFINEPRSNSDIVQLDKFLNIYIKDSIPVFRFDKKFVANYSEIPQNIYSDNKFYYIKESIKKNIVESQKATAHKQSNLKGMYSIVAKVESILSGVETSIKFNFYFNNNEMNLRISTVNSEDAYCEGKYKLIRKDNIVEAVFNDENICTDNKEESNLYFKEEKAIIYVKSKRFINQDWQELKKEK